MGWVKRPFEWVPAPPRVGRTRAAVPFRRAASSAAAASMSISERSISAELPHAVACALAEGAPAPGRDRRAVKAEPGREPAPKAGRR